MHAAKRNVRLVEVDTKNLNDLIRLQPFESQYNFVADNCYSLAEAYANLSAGRYAQPFVTSGLRVGTAAVTTRGLNEADMDKIASLIALAATDFEAKKAEIRAQVDALCNAYPLYA